MSVVRLPSSEPALSTRFLAHHGMRLPQQSHPLAP
jgi:hypothetical protein